MQVGKTALENRKESFRRTICREGKVGRVERKLEDYGQVSRGLVFGAFGEASEGVHEIRRLQAVGLQQGRVSDQGELAGVVGENMGAGAQLLGAAQGKKLVRRGQFMLG